MGGIEPGESEDAGADPPLTVELLADLQAGLLDDGAAARLRKRVRADPDAQQIVHALNRVRRGVAAAGADISAAPAVAPAVIDGIGAALRAASPASLIARLLLRPLCGLHRHRASLITRRPYPRLRAAHAVRPGYLLPPARVLTAAAGWAAATIAVGLATTTLISAPAPTPSELTTAQQITVSRPPMQIPLSDPQVLALLDRKPDYGPFADLQRRASCLAGLGYPVAAQVLGAGPIEIAGRAAVLLVVSGNTSGTVTALAVAPTCSSLNTGLLADRVVNRP